MVNLLVDFPSDDSLEKRTKSYDTRNKKSTITRWNSTEELEKKNEAFLGWNNQLYSEEARSSSSSTHTDVDFNMMGFSRRKIGIDTSDWDNKFSAKEKAQSQAQAQENHNNGNKRKPKMKLSREKMSTSLRNITLIQTVKFPKNPSQRFAKQLEIPSTPERTIAKTLAVGTKQNIEPEPVPVVYDQILRQSHPTSQTPGDPVGLSRILYSANNYYHCDNNNNISMSAEDVAPNEQTFQEDASNLTESSGDDKLDSSQESTVTNTSQNEVSDHQQNRTAPQKKKSTKSSFTADSPYFSAYVDKEVQSLSVLTDTLRDIAFRARKVGQCGAAMADATRRLSISCKLQQPLFEDREGMSEEAKEREEILFLERRESVGEEMEHSLRLLSEVLDEVAESQLRMCENLVASICLPLEKFAGKELQETSNLKAEVESLTDSAESCFARYLHGRHSDRNNTEAVNNQNQQQSQQTNLSNKSQELLNSSWVGSRVAQLGGWAAARSGISMPSKQITPDSSEQNTLDSSQRQTKSVEKDPIVAKGLATANLRKSLQQIRLAQANSELKRFQMLRRLDSLKTRRNFELGESALASLHGLRAYFHHCSDLTQGLSPRLQKLQAEQAESRKLHESQEKPWKGREKGLVDAIQHVDVAALNSSMIVETLMNGPLLHVQELAKSQPKNLEEVEAEVKLWELPKILAETSLYQRDPTPGVIMEGWLYKKNNNRMSLQPWNRRWFILDKTGVYYLRGTLVGDKGSAVSLERVKVCEIVLCTVREATEKTKGVQGLRYCFEIITPNTQPYMLQACGPHDYRLWIDSIRSCIENQLVNGDVNIIETIVPTLSFKRNNSNSQSSDSSEKDTSDVISPDSRSPSNNETKKKGPNIGARLMKRKNKDKEPGMPFSNSSSPQFRIPGLHENDETENVLDTDSEHNTRRWGPLVQKILKANQFCADCNQPNPDWASLNIGVLLCIECGGVHRSLGVHLSKVRSLTLDDISDPEALVLLNLGNSKANSIWEAGITSQKGWKKPEPDAPRKEKEEWIKSKYMWKGFLEYVDDGGNRDDREGKFSKDIYEGARKADIYEIAVGMARGGTIEWKNDEECGKTALHVCVASSKEESDRDESNSPMNIIKRIQCAEFLIQNGAKIDAKDNEYRSVIDHALLENAPREIIEYLEKKMN